jgi:hypothetical protein
LLLVFGFKFGVDYIVSAFSLYVFFRWGRLLRAVGLGRSRLLFCSLLVKYLAQLLAGRAEVVNSLLYGVRIFTFCSLPEVIDRTCKSVGRPGS